MSNISLDIQLSIMLYDVIHLKLTLIGCHYLLACPVNQPESNNLSLYALLAARSDTTAALACLVPHMAMINVCKNANVHYSNNEELDPGIQDLCLLF